MIDVRVREDNRIQILNRYWEAAVLLGGFVALALEHAAVERDRVTIDVQKMARPGYLSGRTNERYLQTISLLLQRRAETES